jgi:imidazolonepropionase-like amidohydrolase
MEAHIDAIKRAHEAGVRVALGTDFCGPDLIPHGENAEEAELYVDEIGMSEMEAIKAATSSAAETLKEPSVGAIEPGRFADLVVLDANPLSDISALRDAVTTVYKSGQPTVTE